MEGLGAHAMWGFSTAKNLLTLSKENMTKKHDEPIHILLMNTSDPRHILSTISKSLNNDRPLYFYILEWPIEVTAKQLLLLYIFMDLKIPIKNRAALFLEVFVNCLIKENVEDYIETAGKYLTEMIYEEEGDVLGSMIDFTMMKCKERDALELVFKSWKKSVEFDVMNYRDYRLRGHFRDRYDCRKNLIDWDYFSKIKTSASIIHIDQYRDWRMNGIAFEFGNNALSHYKAPNRSFASNHTGRVKNGRDVGLTRQVQGYWCDVVVGPYISFGVELCRNNRDDDGDQDSFANDLFRIENKGTGMEQHRHNSGEISMFNLISLMWEFENGKKYKMETKDDIFSGLVNSDDDTNENDKSETTTSHETNSKQKSKIKIIPLGEDVKSLFKKSIYKNKFDVIYISLQAMTSLHAITSSGMQINDILNNEDATICVETTKYAFPLHATKSSDADLKNDDESDSFVPIFMKKIANENNWKEVIPSQEMSGFNSDTVAFRLCKEDKE